MPILRKEPSIYPLDLLQPGSERDGRQWWAVFTKSRQEKALARHLLANRIPFYLPLIPKSNLIRGKVISSYLPLFPRYLFMFGSEDERVQSLSAKRIDQVLHVQDPEQLCRDLRHVHQLIQTDAPLTVERRLMPGQKVRIKSGMLQGLEGTITVRRGKHQLLVAVHFLQNGVSVEISDYMVEPTG